MRDVFTPLGPLIITPIHTQAMKEGAAPGLTVSGVYIRRAWILRLKTSVGVNLKNAYMYILLPNLIR